MKNKILILICILSQIALAQKSKTSIESPAQNNINNLNEQLYKLNENTYRTSLSFGDAVVAKQALYNMIALKPENTKLKDTLAILYLNLGQVQQSLMLSKEIISTSADNLPILEIKAISEQNLGLSKDALATYENLYEKSKNIFHLYQIATLQYELKRLAECNQSVDQILGSPESEKNEININTGRQNQQQKVPLKAAAYNIKGVLAMDLNENAIAKASFEEALKIAPEFVLAKNNLEFIKTRINSTNPTPAGKPNPTKK
jgi:tetratricopeptide (TPR) repeat protein